MILGLALDYWVTSSLSDWLSHLRMDVHVQAAMSASRRSVTLVRAQEERWRLARELDDSSLAGEQQMLLALNNRDVDQVDKAIQYCQAAIASYKDIRSSEMVGKAETLLAELWE